MDGGGFYESGRDPAPQGCHKCSSISFSQDWYAAFGVMLCNKCKKDEQLISKGRAKSVYLLTDRDLASLGCITKDNPQKKEWSSMKLYLQSQVEQLSCRRHGSIDQLGDARQRRLEKRLDDRVRKRKEEDKEAAKEQARQERIRQRIEQESERLRAEYAGEDESLAPVADVEVEEI